MKKLILFTVSIIMNLYSFAQISISCYSDGDTLSSEVLNNATKFEISPDGEYLKGRKPSDIKLRSFEMTININGTIREFKNIPFNNSLTPEMKKAMLESTGKISIENIFVQVQEGQRRIANTTFYRAKKVYKRCDQTNSSKIIYKGKLLMGKNKDIPVQNQKLVLKDKSEKEIQTTTTDKYGDFAFNNVNTNESYKIVLDGNTMKIEDDIVNMAKQDGTIVKAFNKNGDAFTYELLPTELNVLAKIKEEDTELKIKNFGSSKENKLTVIENIYYATNSADINSDSQKKLDKIIKAMQDNKTLKLAIASHTDSKGDDASNMTLSEKRAQNVMEYFISKGIAKERLSAKGYGETQILNRCKNGIDCSETENELNRRTEFKFTK